MKLTRKILPLLLAVCLCAGLSSAAFAAAEPSCTQSPCTHAAAIGQTHFDTVQEAIDTAANGETVTLLHSTAENVTIAADDTLTLDLDGWCLQNAGGHTITNYGTLVLTGDGVVDNVTHAKGALYNAGTAVIENCTLTRSAEAGSAPDNSGGNSWYVVFNAAGGTLRLENSARVLGTSGFSSCLRNDGELTICGGSIEQPDFIALKNDSGVLNMTDGYLYSNDQALQNWSTATISGGTLDGAVYTWGYDGAAGITDIIGGYIHGDVASVSYDGSDYTPQTTISGDTVIDGTLLACDYDGGSYTPSTAHASLSVSGGTFTQAVTQDYLSSSVCAVRTQENGAAYSYYTALSDALADADSGDTIDLTSGGAQTCYVAVTVDDGSDRAVYTVISDTWFTLDVPSRDGYLFDGWYPQGERADVRVWDEYYVDAPITFTACWYADDAQSVTDDDGTVRYRVNLEDPAHGTLNASALYAAPDDKITLTVLPDKSYVLDELSVWNENDDSLKLTQTDDDTFTFYMPESPVWVDAVFVLDTDEAEFDDVSPDAYYYNAVCWALAQEITDGTSAWTFSPDASCTRAQMVTFLWRAAGCPEAENTDNPFFDVASRDYYYDAVLWAVEEGVTGGTAPDTFSPNAPCTRAQAVTFLYRAAGSPDTGSGVWFSDVPSSAYYADAVLWAALEGITTGTSRETFSPDTVCTRAQIVTFLYRSVPF